MAGRKKTKNGFPEVSGKKKNMRKKLKRDNEDLNMCGERGQDFEGSRAVSMHRPYNITTRSAKYNRRSLPATNTPTTSKPTRNSLPANIIVPLHKVSKATTLSPDSDGSPTPVKLSRKSLPAKMSKKIKELSCVKQARNSLPSMSFPFQYSRHYTIKEDQTIIDFVNKSLIINGQLQKPNWQSFEEENICPGRTWQSIRNRWRTSIKFKVSHIKTIKTSTTRAAVSTTKTGKDRAQASTTSTALPSTAKTMVRGAASTTKTMVRRPASTTKTMVRGAASTTKTGTVKGPPSTTKSGTVRGPASTTKSGTVRGAASTTKTMVRGPASTTKTGTVRRPASTTKTSTVRGAASSSKTRMARVPASSSKTRMARVPASSTKTRMARVPASTTKTRTVRGAASTIKTSTVKGAACTTKTRMARAPASSKTRMARAPASKLRTHNSSPIHTSKSQKKIKAHLYANNAKKHSPAKVSIYKNSSKPNSQNKIPKITKTRTLSKPAKLLTNIKSPDYSSFYSDRKKVEKFNKISPNCTTTKVEKLAIYPTTPMAKISKVEKYKKPQHAKTPKDVKGLKAKVLKIPPSKINSTSELTKNPSKTPTMSKSSKRKDEIKNPFLETLATKSRSRKSEPILRRNLNQMIVNPRTIKERQVNNEILSDFDVDHSDDMFSCVLAPAAVSRLHSLDSPHSASPIFNTKSKTPLASLVNNFDGWSADTPSYLKSAGDEGITPKQTQDSDFEHLAFVQKAIKNRRVQAIKRKSLFPQPRSRSLDSYVADLQPALKKYKTDSLDQHDPEDEKVEPYFEDDEKENDSCDIDIM